MFAISPIFFLNENEATEACSSGWLFLRSYQALARLAHDRKLTLFKLRPKLHYFAHVLLALAVTRENPRRRELNTAEDFMGRIKLIGKATNRMNSSAAIVERIMVCYVQRWYRCQHPFDKGTMLHLLARPNKKKVHTCLQVIYIYVCTHEHT